MTDSGNLASVRGPGQKLDLISRECAYIPARLDLYSGNLNPVGCLGLFRGSESCIILGVRQYMVSMSYIADGAT